ncbi:TDT family transporter [Nocardia uniformis]|uniref:TDT family transporter n=1 Tax=Nocardia uniformis TaxID=53432 RepID=A0A849BUI4_9NOCA|nr:TDT family transporter [Nocardia uniformis]NNH68698.1 TDT family transporter [Nocardia uniformis]
MTAILHRPAARSPRTVTRSVRAPRLEPTDAFRHIGPNWFAVVMGTGIVATAVATLPAQPLGLRAAATVVWALAALLLVVITGAFAAHWLRHPHAARAHGRHPVMSHFYGAPPMALMTVGAGALLLGSDVIGLRAALAIDWVLWSAGTALGLLIALAIPYRMMTGESARPEAAFGGWVMPVVSPMVSAATGALLVPHLPAGQARLTMMLGCLAMFGLSLIAALITITIIWSRLLHFGPPAKEAVATVWIVLGPLGQSVTAAGLLANAAPSALPEIYAKGLMVFSVVFGVAAWGFMMLWLGLSVAITVRNRKAMPFNLTWWGFTFPVGTCVTGSSVLFTHTGADLFAVTAVGLYILLVSAWAVVAARTLAGVRHGGLLQPPAPAPAI